jgi:restriction system protein
MARRGFFAELQRQARIAARESERQQRQAARDQAALIRRTEQTRNAEARAQKQLAKSAEAERKRLEKEAKEAHLEAMEAEVSQRNGELAEIYEEIDSLLASTLSRDDHVDLNTLRAVASHPPFNSRGLEEPIPGPVPIPDPPQPVLIRPQPPQGLAKFFGKRKHSEAVADAESAHEHALAEWRAQCRHTEARRQAAREKQARDEAERLEQLKAERARFAEQCKAREEEAAESNRRLEELITNLGYGTVDAVQEYVSIVLSNSVYPEHFQVTHEFEFEPSSAELRLTVLVPGPSEIPGIKAYKYTRASDEITSAALSQKECRERYASAIHQVALRSFHEVFESDRRALIRTISLEVGTKTVDPATGRPAYIPFVIAAAGREAFLTFDLSAVVPALTLGRLGAAVSKSPHSLVAAERLGIRRT